MRSPLALPSLSVDVLRRLLRQAIAKSRRQAVARLVSFGPAAEDGSTFERGTLQSLSWRNHRGLHYSCGVVGCLVSGLAASQACRCDDDEMDRCGHPLQREYQELLLDKLEFEQFTEAADDHLHNVPLFYDSEILHWSAQAAVRFGIVKQFWADEEFGGYAIILEGPDGLRHRFLTDFGWRAAWLNKAQLPSMHCFLSRILDPWDSSIPGLDPDIRRQVVGNLCHVVVSLVNPQRLSEVCAAGAAVTPAGLSRAAVLTLTKETLGSVSPGFHPEQVAAPLVVAMPGALSHGLFLKLLDMKASDVLKHKPPHLSARFPPEYLERAVLELLHDKDRDAQDAAEAWELLFGHASQP